MTPKQQLLQELETTPLPIILQILHFLRVLKAQKSSLDFMDFAGMAADMSEEMDDLVATTQNDRQQDLHRFYQLLDFLLITLIRHHRQQQTSLPLGEFISTLVADIPSSVIETCPVDGSEQHDHYLYGTSKVEVE